MKDEGGRGKALEALEILDGAEATRGAEVAGDPVSAALIVGGWTEAAGGGGFEFEAIEEPVEGEIEIEPGLFAVGDDVKAGLKLIADGDADSVIDQFGAVGATELVEVLAGEFQPPGEGVTADDGGAKGRHEL